MQATVTAHDFPDIRWHGHWIWIDPPVPMRPFAELESMSSRRPEAHALFRKTFSLDQVPARAPARVTADSRYLLYVNGQEAYRGPIRSQPRRLHYDLFDLAPYLQPGENTIAAYVVYYGSPRSFWIPATPSSSLGVNGMLVFEADLGPGGWLVSDATWKTLKSDAWLQDRQGEGQGAVFEGVPIEVFDARRFPYAWEQPGFDDSAWGNAQPIPSIHIGGTGRTQPPADPYGPLYPRPIARLSGDLRTPAAVRLEYLSGQVDENIADPVRRVQSTLDLTASDVPNAQFPLALDVPAGGARIGLDMGRIVMGQVQFAVQAPAGAQFDISYTEEPLARPRGPFDGMHAGTRYIARGENDRFSVFDANGFRYAYLYIHGASGQVTVERFAVQEDVYPWQPGAAFACSDENLNRIYQAGIRTVQLNARDAFTDCPTREQRAWVGDSVVHQMVSLATNTDWRLAWHTLTLGDSPRSDGILPMSVAGDVEANGGLTIPDWSLHWVHGVYNLYRFAGDRDVVKSHMPSIERVLRWYAPYQNAQGLLKDLTEWNLVDWSAVSNDDTTAIITALWARGLHEFAEMAGWLGENASRAWAEGLYTKAKGGFEAFWDEERGSYVDHLVNGVRQPAMSQLAGACAIVSGLAPQERWGRIVDAITNPDALLIHTWMFGGDSPEEAFASFGRAPRPNWDVHKRIILAEPFMSYVVHDAVAQAGKADRLPELCRRWSQFLTGGYDTIGEDWNHGTHVHGWSCTPTRDLIFYTLGVMPAQPGYAQARIAPRLGDLQWAEASVPTPHGLIAVRATPETITIDSPVPVIVDLADQPAQELPAGRHEVLV